MEIQPRCSQTGLGALVLVPEMLGVVPAEGAGGRHSCCLWARLAAKPAMSDVFIKAKILYLSENWY